MQKLIIVFKGQDLVSYSGFTDFMLHVAGKAMEICHPPKIHITFTDTSPPVLSIIPFRKSKIGVLSVYFEGGLPDEDVQHFLTNCISDTNIPPIRLSGCYSAEEALPVEYKRTWDYAEMTPGVCLLTLFKRKHGLSYKTFLDRWHNSHTPLSLKIHPLWHYNRNVVRETAFPGSEPWEGIVEEHFRKRAHLLNPFVFFGNPLSMIPNMIRVYRDTHAFLDYKTMETYIVREVIFK